MKSNLLTWNTYVTTFQNWAMTHCIEKMLTSTVGVSKSANVKLYRNKSQSPFHEMENNLEGVFWAVSDSSCKDLSTKVSRESSEMGQCYLQGLMWLDEHFINCKNIKFRKKKCGKDRTAEEYAVDFEKFLSYVPFDVLPPMEVDIAQAQCPFASWGKVPSRT